MCAWTRQQSTYNLHRPGRVPAQRNFLSRNNVDHTERESMRNLLFFLTVLTLAPLQLFGAVDKELLALAPADTTALASIDVVRARNSKFGQYMLSRMGADDSNLQQFIRQTGFDPRKDLEDIVFASSAASRSGDGGNGLVLARGTFDVSQIEAAAKLHGATVETYHGHYIFVQSHKGEKPSGLAFPLPEVAVIGNLDLIRQALDRSGPAILDGELQRQIDKVAVDHDAWFASSVGPGILANHLMLEANGQDQPAKALQAVLRSAGGLRFGDLMEVNFWAVTRSAQDAASLRDVIRFFASMLQMQREKDQRASIVASSLDNMVLRASGDVVETSFSIAEKDIEQIAELSPPTSHPNRHR